MGRRDPVVSGQRFGHRHPAGNHQCLIVISFSQHFASADLDQCGVELGNALAQRIGGELQGDSPPAGGHDSSTTELMRRYMLSRGGQATSR